MKRRNNSDAQPRKVLVFGGSGQLGSQIARRWNDDEVIAPARSDVNIEDRDAVERAIAQTQPDTVVNCAAYNDVPAAEKDPQRAFAVNAFAVAALAEICARRSVLFVTFSTDYVFDGALGRPYVETDAPRPLNAYGMSKLGGELFTLGQHARSYVVRTCGVYGTGVSTSKGYTFINRILERAKAGERLRVVDDQTISPTYAGDLADGVRVLIGSAAPFGLYHMVNEGAVTWYDFAVEALRQAGIPCEVEPVSSAEFSGGVRRPAFSALENARLHQVNIGMPPWREGLSAMLRDKGAVTV